MSLFAILGSGGPAVKRVYDRVGDKLPVARSAYQEIRRRTGNPNGKHFAANTRAELLRRDYEDFLRTGRPLEMRLLNFVNDPGAATQFARTQAVEGVRKSFGLADAAFNRDLRGYGIELTPEQKAARDRQRDIRESLATVEASNRTKRRMDDLRYEVMGGGISPRSGEIMRGGRV